MRKILGMIFAVTFLMVGITYAQPRGNSSPVIVVLDSTTQSKEITFPYQTRDLYIDNYSTTTGIWINFRGSDTDGIGINGNRYFIGPSTGKEFYDYLTDAITIVIDNTYMGSTTSASPISVIATY